MSTFVPRIRRSLRGFYAELGKMYEDAARGGANAPPCATENEARARLATELRSAVRAGDRVEVNGGCYQDLAKAAEAAPVIPSSDALSQRA